MPECDGESYFKAEIPDYASCNQEEVVAWDMYAAAALTGLLSKLPIVDQEGKVGNSVEDKVKYNRDIAESCRWIADAMLEQKRDKWTGDKK